MTDAPIDAVVIRVTCILGAAWVLALLMHRASASTRHVLWSVALATSLLVPVQTLLPKWQVALPHTVPLPRQAHGLGLSVAIHAVMPVARMSPTASLAAAADRWRLRRPSRKEAVVIWLLGVLAVLIHSVMGMLAARRLRRASEHDAASWMDDARRLASRLGLGHVEFAESQMVSTPLVTGTIRPVVIMPDTVSAWTEERVHAILRHELAHVARRDCLTQLGARLICAVFWFHPLVWLAAFRMRVECEHACDDTVIEAGVRGSTYAAHLVAVATSAGSRAVRITAEGVAMARPLRFERRITSVLDPGVRRVASRAGYLALACFALVTVVSSSLYARRGQAPAPSDSATSNALISPRTFETASVLTTGPQAERSTADPESSRTSSTVVRASVVASAQAPAPAFESAAVRKNPFHPRFYEIGVWPVPDGGFEASASLRTLIHRAWGLGNTQRVEGAAAILDQRFDIVVSAANDVFTNSAADRRRMHQMLQALLIDRFKLKVRSYDEVQTVMVLRQANPGQLGPGLRRVSVDCANTRASGSPSADAQPQYRCGSSNIDGRFEGLFASLAEFAQSLSWRYQFVDDTGLQGPFEVKTMFDMAPLLPEAMAPRSDFTPTPRPSFAQAIRDDLGLRVDTEQRPFPIVVVEQVEEPVNR